MKVRIGTHSEKSHRHLYMCAMYVDIPSRKISYGTCIYNDTPLKKISMYKCFGYFYSTVKSHYDQGNL